MAGEPGPGRNDGDRLANSLRAGDVIALTEVYDAYAPLLYDYCHGLLRDRVEAVGALRNAVIAAREHIDRLTEPERLRGWLYAIARKECMRRRDSPNRHTGQEAPEADGGLTHEQFALREERRMLAHSALAALNGRQRETIDLLVRHGLDEVDLTGVLGIRLEETLTLVERSRADLTAATRAAILAQNNRGDCPELAALVDAWPLSPQASSALVRHVDECPVCGRLEAPHLPHDRLLSVLPVAALPAELRLDVLTAATAEDRADNRRAIAAWTEPFDEYGWPQPYEPTPARARDRPPRRRRGPLIAAVAAVVAVVVLAVGAMSALGGRDGRTTAAATGPTAPADSGAPEPEPTPTEPSPLTTSPSPTPSETPTQTPSPSKTPTPARTPTTSAPPRETDEPTPPRDGRLSVQGCSMGRDHTCTVRITAVDGPVNWRMNGSSGDLLVEGNRSGRLSAGESAGLSVRRTNFFCRGERNGTVSFSPGGSARVEYC